MTIKTERTRALNDALRTIGNTVRVMLTRSILALPSTDIGEILRAVATFNDFNDDNDPYGEHDCAILTAAGQKVMFKIDYYDPSMTSGSEDPSDPSRTARVMTIMLASDY